MLVFTLAAGLAFAAGLALGAGLDLTGFGAAPLRVIFAGDLAVVGRLRAGVDVADVFAGRDAVVIAAATVAAVSSTASPAESEVLSGTNSAAAPLSFAAAAVLFAATTDGTVPPMIWSASVSL